MASRPVVLVTGAARRIGREIVLHLAAAGWDVALHYRASQSEAEATAAEARKAGKAHRVGVATFGVDLADETRCRALIPMVAAEFGRLDAIVNNASLFEYDDLDSFGHAAMERHWRANVAPAVMLTRALHRLLEGSEHTGCVVNLSDQKLWNPNPDYLSYTLSKAALDAATVMLAQACAPRVRVCAVAPGVSLPSPDMAPDTFSSMHRQVPLKRLASPLDIARSVRFLLESPAISGTTLLVDGGQHLQRQARDVMFLETPAAPGGK